MHSSVGSASRANRKCKDFEPICAKTLHLNKGIWPWKPCIFQGFRVYSADIKIDYTEEDFERDLLTHELAFKEWRYFHEGKPLPTFDLQFMSTLQAYLKGIAIFKNNGAI